MDKKKKRILIFFNERGEEGEVKKREKKKKKKEKRRYRVIQKSVSETRPSRRAGFFALRFKCANKII